jgi:hypothetical protein
LGNHAANGLRANAGIPRERSFWFHNISYANRTYRSGLQGALAERAGGVNDPALQWAGDAGGVGDLRPTRSLFSEQRVEQVVAPLVADPQVVAKLTLRSSDSVAIGR